MIIIKSIEMIEVSRDPWEILNTTPYHQPIKVRNSDDKIERISYDVFRELIQGSRFVRPDGKELIVGCSKQAEEIIGIQYDSWNDMSRGWEDTRTALHTANGLRLKAEGHLLKIKQIGFLGRLTALFKGYDCS